MHDEEEEKENGEPRLLERGHRSDSYLFAVKNNRIPLRLDPPADEDVSSGIELIVLRKLNLLSADELEFYRLDSFWKRLRLSLLIAFWLTWILLLLGAICLVFVSPKCDPVEVGKWWTSALIYEIWTSSFQDTDADGVGDLAGVRSRLADLRRIGVDALFLRQLLKTDASGMGVINFLNVDERIGTLADAIALIDACHAHGIRVIIDFPLVVTSSAHSWFRRSARAHLPENAKFSAFYYWKRGVTTSPYVSEYDNASYIFYFHVRDRPDLPVLNWNSALVAQAIRKAISFWIDKSIDGIHFSSIDYLHRSFDGFQPEWDVIMRFLRGIRDHVQDYSRSSRAARGKEIFVMASPGDLKEEQKRRLATQSGFSGVLNTEPTRIALRNRICYRDEATVAGCVNEILADLLRFYTATSSTNENVAANNNNNNNNDSNVPEMISPAGIWPVWSFSSSFTSRLATRLRGRRHAELLMMVELCLPGTPLVYYGEELGMSDCCYDAEPMFRGRGRMPWDAFASNYLIDAENLVTTSSKSPLSIINFRDQMRASDSQLATFRRLTRLRRSHRALGPGGASRVGARVENAFALCRYLPAHERYQEVIIIAVNFGNFFVELPLQDLPPFSENFEARKNSPPKRRAHVLAVDSGGDNASRKRHYVHEKLDLTMGRIHLSANEGVVFKLI